MRKCLLAVTLLLLSAVGWCQTRTGGGSAGITPGAACGDASHALSWTGSAYGCQAITGSAAAGGSSGQIQWNNATSLGGVSGWTTNGTTTLTGGATSILDLSAMAAGGLKVPTGAGLAPTADGNLAVNSTTHALAFGSNGSTVTVAGVGAACSNQVVTALGISGPTCTTLTSAYVNNSIALTGTDINTSNQVTATHLAAALPINQGGTATTNAPIKRMAMPYAGCNNTTAAPSWDLPASSPMVAACKTDGTNGTVQGVLQANDGQIAYYTVQLPPDWSSFGTVRLSFTTSDTTNGHTIIWSLATACTQPNNNLADTPAYNAAQTVTTTLGASAVANALYQASIASVTGTGCSAGYILHLKLSRSTDTDTDTAVALTGWLALDYNGSYQ